ncbi:MAG: CHAT domain-containing protein [Bacteroidales bacterium]|nr:CHAT domain-containing protein [Bacteroidales bacterium]
MRSIISNGIPAKSLIRFLLALHLFFAGLPYCAYAQNTGNSYCDSSIILNNLGADYYTAGDWDMAKATLMLALEYTRRCNPADSFELIPSLLNLGGIYTLTWQYENALELFLRAERIYETSPTKNPEYLSHIYTRIGRTYSALGDYSKAEEYYNNALLLFQEFQTYSEVNKAAIVTLYNGYGVLSKRMKKYQQAIALYNKAVDFAVQLKPSFLSFLYGNIANAYRELKEYEISEEYFLRAISGKSVNNYQDSIDLTIILTDYSSLLLDEKKPEQAKSIIEQAQQLCYGIWGSRNPQHAEIMINMGKYYALTGNIDKAIYWYQQSILSLYADQEIFVPGITSLPKNIISKQHFLVGLKTIANAFQVKYNLTDSIQYLKKSLNIYEQSIMLADNIRHGFMNNDSRLFLAENEKATLNAAIHIARDLHALTSKEEYLHKAFEFSERSKAALLLSSIQSNTAITFGGIPETLGNEEKNLIREISMTEETIYEEEQKSRPNAQKLLKWKNNLLKLKRDYEALINTLEQNYPRYYKLKYRNNLIQVKELVSLLSKNYNLVEYNLEDTTVTAFIINRKGIVSIETPVNQVFHNALASVLQQLQQFDPTKHTAEQFRKYCSFSYELYNSLFKPVEKYLVSDKVILIPDQVLSYLPFEIMLTEPPEKNTGNYRNLSYLMKKYTLSYSYSASLLMDEHIRRKKPPNRKVLAIAPLYSHTQESSLFSPARRHSIEHLYPLPGACEEVKYITRLLKGRLLVDSMATEKAFKKFAPEFGILHLAMHTLINNQNPMYSKLVFTQWLNGPDEGMLNTYELYNMKLNARMVVLSACRSGDGVLQQGEGIMSLARGFLYAGCPSLIMTLWNVEDKSGMEVMQQFYHHIKKGRTKDIALRSAKLNYLTSAVPHKTHPYYWAGYLQIGDPIAIFVPSWFKNMLIALLTLLLLIILITRSMHKRIKR